MMYCGPNQYWLKSTYISCLGQAVAICFRFSLANPNLLRQRKSSIAVEKNSNITSLAETVSSITMTAYLDSLMRIALKRYSPTHKQGHVVSFSVFPKKSMFIRILNGTYRQRALHDLKDTSVKYSP